MAASLYPRLLRPRLGVALSDTPVFLLNGPRQAGKTRLVRQLANVGIEVKASATVATSDFAGLRKLAALAGKAWRAGYLLYDGPETLPMGPGMWAVPLAGLALG